MVAVSKFAFRNLMLIIIASACTNTKCHYMIGLDVMVSFKQYEYISIDAYTRNQPHIHRPHSYIVGICCRVKPAPN